VADIGRLIEAKQPRRRRIEPHDLVVGVENDAAVGQRARALAHLPQQAVVFLLAVARFRSQLVDACEHFRPQAARLEQGNTAVAVERTIEQIQVTQRERRVQQHCTREPPTRGAEPPAEAERHHEERGERRDL
jgi:hypothetical protein